MKMAFSHLFCLLFYIFQMLLVASSSRAENQCLSIFLAKPLNVLDFLESSPQTVLSDFLSSLDLESRRILESYLETGRGLAPVNEYLKEHAPSDQKTPTIFESSANVSDTTLIRVAQWIEIFRNAMVVPEGTVLYLEQTIPHNGSVERAISELSSTGHYLKTTTSSLHVKDLFPSQPGDDIGSWHILYTLNIGPAIRAIPGRSELGEVILDRNIQVVPIQITQFPKLRIAFVEVAVENIEHFKTNND